MWKTDTSNLILINFKGFQLIFDEKLGFISNVNYIVKLRRNGSNGT